MSFRNMRIITDRRSRCWLGLLSLSAVLLPQSVHAAHWTLVGWNNLGMHCMDGDYALFSLLPPYNTIHAQLMDAQGHLVTDPAAAGVSVTYEATADPDNSINTSSLDKTNFWEHVDELFGASLPPDVGLTGVTMPGATNLRQSMSWDNAMQWFVAEGIPITPYDDLGNRNPYPMMRLVARNASGAVLATTDIVLPVSDEMSCSSCHSSSSGSGAEPPSGWANDPNPDRDMRLNVLRLHDDRQASDPAFHTALAAVGYDPAGLSATAIGGRSILCASCHLSEALPGSGQPGVAPLTRAIHGRHSHLDADNDGREACYRCHPGSATRCLRGAMGAAVAADGTMAMQCQSCHGTMAQVASDTRTGWLQEPSCQQCHSGTATHNNGQIRYTSVYDSDGAPRAAVDSTFATNPNTPAAGLDLYRFSAGHGGIKCEGCHGSTHAEFPSSHRNDNIQSIEHQGHVGMLAECVSCHPSQPTTVNGGPHGMHPVGQSWVERHHDVVESTGASACRACHGADYRGTVLSRAKADRLLSTDFGGKYFWRGFQVGCYNCHRGPSNEDANSNRAAAVLDDTASVALDTPATIPLRATDADGNALQLRIVSQAEHGRVALSGAQATYLPDAGFVGQDSFTFAAWDGSTDSNLGTIRLAVGAPAATATPTRTAAPATATRTSAPSTTPTSTPGVADLCDSGIVLQEARLKLRGNELNLSFHGEALLPDLAGSFDPIANGIRFRIDDATGGAGLDITLPGGARSGDHGWAYNPGAASWSYLDPTGGVGGVQSFKIRNRSARKPGLWDWTLRAKGGIVSLPSINAVRVEVLLDGPTRCAAIRFNGPTGVRPRCSGDTNRISCR